MRLSKDTGGVTAVSYHGTVSDLQALSLAALLRQLVSPGRAG
ncbi:MAG: hypothetical protein ABIP41_09495 [Croceibacterium sp.]